MRPSFLMVAAVAAGSAAADPVFRERAAALGLDHRYTGGWEHYVGGGVAAFDCNGDDLPELFAAGGAAASVLFLNKSAKGGEVVFEDATPPDLALTGVTGAYPLDIDGDGILDLAVLRVGKNAFLKGAANCAFTPITAFDLLTGTGWSTAFSATWEKGQVLPTMAVGNYVDRSDPNGPFEACDGNILYRPVGNTYALQELRPGYCPLSMLFSDWGRKGQADLRVSNDRHYYVRGGHEQLWAMTPVPRLYGPADGWQAHQLWGMGIASRDVTGDGLPEIYLSSMGDQRLQMLEKDAEGPSYADVPYDWGTTAHRPYLGDDGRPSTGWHIAFGDVQNDGMDDVFIAKGNVEQMPSNAMSDPNSLLIRLPDGRFSEFGGAAGVGNPARSRGAAMVDLNLDGRLDLAVMNRNAPLEILQNVTAQVGNWMLVRLADMAPNTQAVGAWVEVDVDGAVQAREITVGGGHVSGAAGFEHFGLGQADGVRLRVIWPDGVTSDWVSLDANQILQVTRSGAELDVTAR